MLVLAVLVTGLAAPVQIAHAEDPTLLCGSAPDPVRCADTERRIWIGAADHAAKLGPAALPNFCGAASCVLRGTVAASLATEAPGGVSCVLGSTCDLLPAIAAMRANGLGSGDDAPGVQLALGRLDGLLARGLGSGEPPTADELVLFVMYLSGTPKLPPGIEDLRELAASRNLLAYQARAYDNGEFDPVATPNDPTDLEAFVGIREVTSSGMDIKVPPGCTAAFTFGTPWFFTRKEGFGFTVLSHYGQHLDSFAIVDKRTGGPFTRCPGTRADITFKVGAKHYGLWPLSGPDELTSGEGTDEVTAYWNKPYVNCYDRTLCDVVQIYADDRRSVLGGEFVVDLYHTWDLSHGYNDKIYTGADYEPGSGYYRDAYDRWCKWLGLPGAGAEAMVPEECGSDA